MNNEQERRLLRTVSGAWCGKRNVGNMTPEEIDLTGQLIKEKLIKTSTYKNSEWCELTETGIKRLFHLNGLGLGV
jgi:hypothetical protein